MSGYNNNYITSFSHLAVPFVLNTNTFVFFVNKPLCGVEPVRFGPSGNCLCVIKETSLRDFLIILKRVLLNWQKILIKCFLGTNSRV